MSDHFDVGGPPGGTGLSSRLRLRMPNSTRCRVRSIAKMGVRDETQPCTGRENREPTTDRSHSGQSSPGSAAQSFVRRAHLFSIVEPADDEIGISPAKASGIGCC